MFAPSKRSDAMKLKISFDDIAPAFEQASDSSLYMFIDTKENRIVVLSDNEATDADFEIMKRPRYVALPRRDSKDDYFRMESFTYVMSCCDLELVQKFHKALRQNKPFGNFRDLLSQHLEHRAESVKEVYVIDAWHNGHFIDGVLNFFIK